jgi:hypothetical protein
MNEHAIEILTPLLGDVRAREVCALVSLAEACAQLGQQLGALQAAPPVEFSGPRAVEPVDAEVVG